MCRGYITGKKKRFSTFDLYLYHQFVWQITGQPSVLYYAVSIFEVHGDLDLNSGYR